MVIRPKSFGELVIAAHALTTNRVIGTPASHITARLPILPAT